MIFISLSIGEGPKADDLKCGFKKGGWVEWIYIFLEIGNFPESHIINPYWSSLFGQDGWILASFFFCMFMNLDSVSVHRHAKKELGQYPAILNLQDIIRSVTWGTYRMKWKVFTIKHRNISYFLNSFFLNFIHKKWKTPFNTFAQSRCVWKYKSWAYAPTT